MTPKKPLQRFIDFVNSSKVSEVNTLVFYGYEIDELQKFLKKHKRLQEFKETFDNYELAKKQDFIAYENWLECERELAELQELKKRDTPMKLTQASRFTTDKKLYGMYACNNCHEVIPYITLNSKRVKPKFCYHCGQRLDWSGEK